MLGSISDERTRGLASLLRRCEESLMEADAISQSQRPEE